MDQAKSTARTLVYEQLRERIVKLRLPPNAPISENDLAAELGVSRTPVREGLLLLREEGYVQVFPKMGTFVAPMDVERIKLLQFVREAIECSALAQLDPALMTPARLTAIEENLAAQRLTTEHTDIDQFMVLDERFHSLLLELSGRQGAWPFVQSIKGHLDRARRIGLTMRPITHFIAQHERIVADLAAGEVAAATEELRTHLREILVDLAQMEQDDPELFDPRPKRPVRRTVTILEPS